MRNQKWLLIGLMVAGFGVAQSYKPEAIQQATLGVSLAKKQDYRGAVEAYKKALAVDARLPNLYLNLGLAYFKQGQFRNALGAFEKEPASERTGTLIGMSHFGLGEYKQAAAVLQPLAAAHPENAELGYLLAKSYLWAGQHEQAMGMFRTMLEHDPNSAAAHMLLGEALDADDREQEATEEFEAAVKMSPQLPDVHFSLGYLYWKQRRYAEAALRFQAELNNNPEQPQALAYLGDIRLRDGQSAEALRLLKKAEGLDANLHVVHQDLGIHYQGAGQLDFAMKEFQAAVRTAPGNYDAHYRLARIYRQAGREAEALKEFAIVQKLHESKSAETLMQVSGPR